MNTDKEKNAPEKNTSDRQESQQAGRNNASDSAKAPQQRAEGDENADSIIRNEQESKGYDPDTLQTPAAGAVDQAENPDEAQIAAASPEQTASDMPVTPAVDHTLKSDEIPDLDDPKNISKGEVITPAVDDNTTEVTESHDEDEESHDEDETTAPDYDHLSKEELVRHAVELVKLEDVRRADKQINEIKQHLDEMQRAEQKDAFDRYVADNGSEEGFLYQPDELFRRFDEAYRKIKEEKHRRFSEINRQREDNLRQKNEILARLREFVDSEESNTSLRELKKIQEDWKKVGPVPSQYNNNLWANYNALLDRFYNNRSILYELKELDRRKNLEAKQDIVLRAEKLLEYDNLKQATRELRELHEEFRHIGPVPREEQEPLWNRFKHISDKIYDKRRDHLKVLNEELEANLMKKRELGDKVQEFLEFDSDRITEWNEKTKQLLAQQKEWEQIGGLPRQVAKEVNKYFWSAFKGFFNNKNRFFKELERKREENLQQKEALVTEAESLKDNENWGETAERFKELQRRWKEIGPVPEKQRDEVYKRFKAAADAFFERKRSQGRSANAEQEENLKAKMDIIKQIEQMAASETQDIEKFLTLEEEYESIGFVPRNAINKVRESYSSATEKFIQSLKDVSPEDREKLRLQSQLSRIKSTPDSDRKLRQKENNIRRQMSKIENDISLWQNNLEFFASSKNADKLKVEFTSKIEEAQQELDKLREQLRIVIANES